MLDGKGKMNYPDGSVYDGEYRKDEKNGQGVYSLPDGKIYDGPWKKGLQHGEAMFTNSKGVTKKGVWKKGKRERWIGGYESTDYSPSNSKVDTFRSTLKKQ